MNCPWTSAVSTALLALVLMATGCEVEPTMASRASLTYTEDAQAAYNEALAKFRSKDWEDARALFTELRKLFTYSKYAKLAELRMADIDFNQQKYSEAIAGYRDFIQNHRTDPDVEYAKYRSCKALFLDIEDTVMLPPAEERDQATTMEAFRELRGFLRDFPKSRYKVDVNYMYEHTLQRLVRHELYVARFYLKQDKFDATIGRIDSALTTYPRSGLDAEALVLKGETLLKMKKREEARDVFQRVVDEHGGPFGRVAMRFLDELGGPKAKAAPKAPAEPAKPDASPPMPLDSGLPPSE